MLFHFELTCVAELLPHRQQQLIQTGFSQIARDLRKDGPIPAVPWHEILTQCAE